MKTWRTLANGAVEVDGAISALTGQDLADFRARVERWRPQANASSVKHGIPAHWILGTIYAESRGNPNVVSSDGGYGLMQLTHASAFEGHAPKSTLGPGGALNIDLGTAHIRRAVDLLRKAGEPPDLPRVASIYNAGATSKGPHPSAKSEWGMRETPGHIAKVVAAANTALADHVAPPPPGAPSDGFPLTVCLLAFSMLTAEGS